VDGITVETCGEPFGFNIWPWSQDELERAKHVEDLVEHGVLTVNIDAAQMGVGGDNSWGARPHDEYLIKPGREYALSFRIRQRK
jgi:beta-galactosidase